MSQTNSNLREALLCLRDLRDSLYGAESHGKETAEKLMEDGFVDIAIEEVLEHLHKIAEIEAAHRMQDSARANTFAEHLNRASACISSLAMVNRDEVDRCLVSCVMQCYQILSKAVASSKKTDVVPTNIDVLLSVLANLDTKLKNGVLWTFLKSVVLGSQTPHIRIAAMKCIMRVFYPAKALLLCGSVLCSDPDGLLLDAVSDLRRAGISAAHQLWPALQALLEAEETEVSLTLVGHQRKNVVLSVQRRLTDGIRVLALLDPVPSVRREATAFMFECCPYSRELVNCKVCDRDKQVRVGCLRYLLSLEPSSVLAKLQESDLLFHTIIQGISAVYLVERRLTVQLFSLIVKAAPDFTELLVHLQVCDGSSILEETLKTEISRVL
ncbi:hypothetical protein DIPPA_52338 [Diplonema papillatum]|nr:hypothetical protein DIPPA_52338 [Diplonema papillatum]